MTAPAARRRDGRARPVGRVVLTAAVAALALAPTGAAAELAPPPEPAVDGPPPASWPAPPEVDATAWLLVEAATGQVLAAHAADERRPVASTVKVLTALTVITRTDPDDVVVAGDEVADVGGALVGLEPGDEWTVEQLLDALIARSGNDAGEALAVYVAGSREAFLELMRTDARRLGLDGVTIVSPSGLDDGNRLSAHDLATIARTALAHPDLRPLLAHPTVDLPGLGEVESRNLLLTDEPGATGVKTGFTVAAGNSLVASARRDGRELVAVVLDAGDDPARFEQAARLLDHGFGATTLTSVGGRLAVAVAGGEVALEVDPTPVTVATGTTPDLAFTLPVRAPQQGTAVPLEVAGAPLTTLPAELDASDRPAPAAGGADLGRRLADAAYATVRAATAAGHLR